MIYPHLAEKRQRAYVRRVKFLATLFGIWAAAIIWLGRMGTFGPDPVKVAVYALAPGLIFLLILFMADKE